jgi:YgiT-type zinc finger domain-containing protein
MKCIICHSTDITMRRVNEQLSRGEDLILVPLEVLVCNNCGERYYDRRAMKRLEEIEDAVNAGRVPLERVGEVLRISQEMVAAWLPSPCLGVQYLADVYAALAYYYDHRSEIDRSIEADKAFGEAFRGNNPSLLQAKLNELTSFPNQV